MKTLRGWCAARSTLAVLSLGLVATAGCGGSNREDGKTVYFSPAEINQKKADLQDAMKGGAYGSAGRNSAPKLGL